MKNSMRRITSLFLTAALVLVAFAPSAVSAQKIVAEDNVLGLVEGSANALYSVRGAQIPAVYKEGLELFNIVADEDTLIEVIPCGLQEGATALAVIEREGASVTRSVIVSYGEDGQIQPMPIPSEAAATASEGFGNQLNPFGDGSIVVTWAVLYNRYVSRSRYCYQPVHAQIMYRKNGNRTVNSMEMSYVCSGFECDYPSFNNRNEGDFTHWMLIYKNNPDPNNVYVSSNAYRTDRVICVNPGNGSHRVHYTMTIDGNTDSWVEYIPLEQ